MDLLANDDGSITLYIGPTKPEGDKAKNRNPTVKGRAWFSLFSLLLTDRGLLRPQLGAAGHREGQVA
jgi:hypothetical protein